MFLVDSLTKPPGQLGGFFYRATSASSITVARILFSQHVGRCWLGQERHKSPVWRIGAEIIAAGKAFEPLLSKYLDAQFIWTRLSREASDETDAKFPSDDFDGPGENPKWAFHLQMGEQNGCRKASERLSEIHEEMEPLADLIRETASETIEGLRAKTLVAIWDCQPIYATHEGGFNFSKGDSHCSLFHAAVAITGLTEMVSAIAIRLQIDAGIPQDGEV